MHLTLHLTDRCNLACSYCYAKPGQSDMSLETAYRAIGLCAQGPNCGIIFFGGEPLLRQDLIWEIIKWCECKQPGIFHYKVTTNGMLLDAEFFEKAEQYQLHVALSHDGIKTMHDRCRVSSTGGGSFETLYPKLSMLMEAQPYAPVMMAVNPETVRYYARSVRWLSSLGIQYIIASLNYAGAWDEDTLNELCEQYSQLADWHEENYLLERKIYFSPFDKRIASHIFPERSNSCQLGRRQISVAPDGSLYPCVQFVGRKEYCIGTIQEGLDHDKRETLYQLNENDKIACQGCSLRLRCHNKCGCLNIQTTGELTTIPPILCEHERMLIPIADCLAERLFKQRNAMFIQRHYNQAFPVLSFLEDLSR